MSSLRLRSAALVLVCVLCYYNSTQCGFVFDDISAIKENRDLRPHTAWTNVFLNDFWGTAIHKVSVVTQSGRFDGPRFPLQEQSHKSYRPFCVLTFRWNYAVHGLQPGGYHLVNMLLHVCVSLLYFRACLLLVNGVTSFVAALLFAVHPVHTEAVTGVVGRAEILSSVFYLSAFIFYTKAIRRNSPHLLLLAMFAVFVSMLCKEQGITITGICAVYEIFVAQKVYARSFRAFLRSCWTGKRLGVTSTVSWWPHQATVRLILLCLTTVGLLLFRLYIMGSQLPVFTR